MAPGKALFTLPLTLDHKSKWNEMKWHEKKERYTADQDSKKSRGPAKSFPKLNNSPTPLEKKTCQNCAIPPGFPGGRRTGKQMIGA